LPGHTPPEKVWDNIWNELLFEENLKNTLSQLPNYVPDKKIWQSINSGLDLSHKTITVKPTVRKIVWITSGIAASILAILFIKNVNKPNDKGVSISYSEEIVYEDIAPVNDSGKGKKALEFIKEQCRRNETTCSSIDFQDKIKELEKVDNELKKVNEMEMLSGSSSALITSEIKLTNLRSQLIKELINYFTS